jgi:hypothetical protein
MSKSKVSNFLLQMSAADLTQSPSQRSFLDIVRNHDYHHNGRRFSIETLVWARHLQDILLPALHFVHPVLPLGEDLFLIPVSFIVVAVLPTHCRIRTEPGRD